VHQIAFGGWALSRHAGGAYSIPPDLLAGLRGAYVKEKGMEREWREWREWRKEEEW